MANRRSYVAAGEIAGRIYVAGGMVGNTGWRLDVVQAFDPERQEWTTLPRPPERVCGGRRDERREVPRSRRNGRRKGAGARCSSTTSRRNAGARGRRFRAFSTTTRRSRWTTLTSSVGTTPRARSCAPCTCARAPWALAAIDRAPTSGARVWRRGLPGRDLGDRRPAGRGTAPRGVDLTRAHGSLARWPDAAEADGASRRDGRRGRDSRRLGGHVPDLRRSNRPLADGPPPIGSRHALSLFEVDGSLYAVGGCTPRLRDTAVVERRVVS